MCVAYGTCMQYYLYIAQTTATGKMRYSRGYVNAQVVVVIRTDAQATLRGNTGFLVMCSILNAGQ